MKTTLTITSKGQTTIPVELRRKLGVGKQGGVLQLHFNEKTGEAVISNPPSFAALSERFSKYIKPGTKPVLNADEYYQKHRQARD